MELRRSEMRVSRGNTLFQGAENFSDCIYPSGTYYEPLHRGCVASKVGLECPGGFAPLQIWPGGERTMDIRVDLSVMIMEGFMSSHEALLQPYECANPGKLRCPGFRGPYPSHSFEPIENVSFLM